MGGWSDSIAIYAAIPVAATIVYVAFDTLDALNKKYPPIAPKGWMETIRIMTSSEYPWFLLRTMREMNSTVFRLRAPLPGAKMVVAVGDTDLAREILADSTSFRPEPLLRTFKEVTMGHRPFITANGAYWHGRRKGVSPAFATKHVRRMNAVASEKTEEWINRKLLPTVATGESFDVSKEMLSIVLDAICETAFQYPISEEEKTSLLAEFAITIEEFAFKSVSNPLRLMLGFLFPEVQRARRSAENIHNLSKKIIAHFKALEDPIPGTIIERILQNDVYENDDQRAADITVAIFAGHDTTAFTLAWILIELAKNPSEQTKLREAILKAPPADWSRLDEVQYVIRESMRVNPVIATGTIRGLGRDYQTKDGSIIPKGAYAITPHILTHRGSAFTDPDTFSPSRWANPTEAMKKSMMTFGHGKMNCVGQSLAMAELHSIIPRLISEFDFSIEKEADPSFFLTLKPTGTMLKARKL